MKKDTPKQETSGLTIPQIDAITLEICHAETLTKALHKDADCRNGESVSFFMLLERQLATVKDMVLDCQQGGRPQAA